MPATPLEQAFALLEALLGHPIDAVRVEQLQCHLSLVQEWNDSLHLVSENDAHFLEERHLIDSLSLVPYVLRYAEAGGLLDIGPGGGFPVIPIKCILPELPVVMVERSVRKSSYLLRVIARLGLRDIDLIQGPFPEVLPKITSGCITARAVERPTAFHKQLLSRMPVGAHFLCQSDVSVLRRNTMFHVEHVNDPWRQSALRRGELHIISKKLKA
ncbi:MAG: RsmG family class I SAM-dependent methyltransferase [Candidatus Hydrogenedentales bacterium]|jgi:16S rRNA (guanine(527)-N(7))-methyltransferase RsmG